MLTGASKPAGDSEAVIMLRNWIALQSGLDPARIGATDSLLGGEFLDSFALLSLTAVVEELLGRTLSQEECNPNNFSTLDKIETMFFNEEPDSEA